MRYLMVDVFARGPLSGNQLAVFADAAGIAPELMQPIARELNLSETTFVTEASGDSYRVRIFTPGAELPFAGHPTLGTAWTLRHLGMLSGERVTQHSAAGETPVSLDGDRARFERGGTVGAEAPANDAARALAIDASLVGCETGGTTLRPAVAGAGVEQLMVPLSSPEAVAAVRIVPSMADVDADGVYCFSFVDERRIKARFFAPSLGIGEDPATGSAAAGLGLYLGARLGGGEFEISQGEEIGRPSTIELRCAPGRAEVGGRVALVAEGRLVI